MSERLYRQVELVSGKTRLVCWLPSDEVRLKPGLKLTLEGDDTTLWTIQEVYRTVQVQSSLRKDWKVGGLT